VKRRLLLLTAFTSALALLTLAAVIVPLVRPRVTARLERDVRADIVRIASFVQDGPTDAEVAKFLKMVDVSPDHRIGVISSSGLNPMGTDAERMRGYVNALSKNTAVGPRENVAYLSQRVFDEPDGAWVASQGLSDGRTYWIIDGRIPTAVISRHQRDLWLAIAGLGALAMLVSLGGALAMARRLTRPMEHAVAAAEALGDGDLRALGPVTGTKEVVALGAALNKLAGRIDRLLTGERDRAATLSHRLRTPLTVLRLETDRLVADLGAPPEDDRVRQAMRDLERGLDQLIAEFQETRDDGLEQRTDLCLVLRDHLAFWAPVAAVQGRDVAASVPEGPLWVVGDGGELGTAVDALIGNIFRHTAAGNGYAVTAVASASEVVLTVRNDRSPEDPDHALGSTGMGLSIVRQIVEVLGGHLGIEQRQEEFTTEIRLRLSI